jgi:hypothetical protein
VRRAIHKKRAANQYLSRRAEGQREFDAAAICKNFAFWPKKRVSARIAGAINDWNSVVPREPTVTNSCW